MCNSRKKQLDAQISRELSRVPLSINSTKDVIVQEGTLQAPVQKADAHRSHLWGKVYFVPFSPERMTVGDKSS